jgi:hypothetical protein
LLGFSEAEESGRSVRCGDGAPVRGYGDGIARLDEVGQAWTVAIRLFAGLDDGQLWESRNQGDSSTRCLLRGDELRALVALAEASG